MEHNHASRPHPNTRRNSALLRAAYQNNEYRYSSYNTGRGRYQAPDTARVSEISKVSLPDLSFGKAPSPSVWSHLTLGNYKDLASNDKRRKAIEVWQKLEWLLMQRQRSRKEKTPCTNVPFWSTAATIKQVMEHRKEQNLEGACCANTPFPPRAPWC
jgi:hypothetical protein